MCTIKSLPGVDTSQFLSNGDYFIRAEDVLEMFKNHTRQS